MSRSVLSLVGPVILLATLLPGCHDDEGDSNPSPPHRDTITLTYENPLEIEIAAARQWALLLHDRHASSGPAVQLVDLNARQVLATQILNYYDVYDIEFLPNDEACFAGRPHGNIGYAVQFVHLPDLTLGTRVMLSDTAGAHGYLAVDTTGGFVYYTHAGGGTKDAIYRIRLSTQTIIDADNDGQPPYGFDNGLVGGLFDHPARIFFDESSGKLVAANLGADFITFVDASLWGTLERGAGLTFPIAGTAHLSTASASINGVRADGMATGAGVYVFAGTAGGFAYLSRFEIGSNGLDLLETAAGRQWRYRNADIRVHPRQDIFSVFVLQTDSAGVGVGQYRLNNLQLVAGSPYRPLVIPDTSLCAVGIDPVNDRLVLGDAHHPRLELMEIR
ncbi:MAG: hypothetical protein NT025_03195 [bacterium]|nr:hypothetical protein [bacterium]